MSQPLLKYGLQLSQSTPNGVTANLTSVNTCQMSTVAVVVANRGTAVTIDSLTFDFGVFGQDGTDLVASASDIAPIAPDGWQCVPGTTFTIVPSSGSAVVGTSPLTFVFDVTVNPVAGVCSLAITEVSTDGTAHVSPMQILKVQPAIILANLTAAPTVVNPASPMLLEPNGTVTLSWDCTPGQVYTIGLPGNVTETYQAPAGASASWTSPAVVGTNPTVTYTVSISGTALSGNQVTSQLSTTLNVDVAQVNSFGPPGAFYASPITLHWETSNADYCELWANGAVVDQNAPVNPGAAGYQIYPEVQITQYQLYAYRHQTPASSPVVIVTLYDWAQTNTVPLPNTDTLATIALSRKGTVLYYAGNAALYAYDTTSFALLGTGVVSNPYYSGVGQLPAFAVSNSGLVLSPDDATLYAGIAGGQVLVFQASNITAPPVTIPVTGGPLAMSPDGSTLYVASSAWGMPAGGVVCAVDTTTHAVTKHVNLVIPGYNTPQPNVPAGVWYIGDAVDMKLSPDGATLYVLMSGLDQGNSPLYAIDTATFVATQVATAAAIPMALTFDGATLYCGADEGEGKLTVTVKALATRGFASTNVATLAGPAVMSNFRRGGNISGMGTDHSGGLFVSIALEDYALDGESWGTTLLLVDPATGTIASMGNISYDAANTAFTVNATDTAAYFTNGQAIMALSSSGAG